MSGAKSSQGGLTRRNFLKTTGAVAGAAAVGGMATPALQALATEYRQGQPASDVETITPGVCRPNCFAYCRLNIHVRDGNIVKTSMGEFADPYLNRACLRGLSHVQRIYDPERVKYPMRRAGERGENQWERISWDEAIGEVADKFTSIQKEYGQQAVSFSTVSGNMGLLHGGTPGISSLLKNIINATTIAPSVDNALTVGTNRVTGNMGPWVGNEPKDMINSKTVMAWGNNLTDAQVHEWHSLVEAMENGTKLVVIDPTFTQLAAKADLWVPVRPASDAALALSMMYVVLTRNAQDEDFLKAHTVAPFLVRSDTGKFVRMSELGVAPTEGPVNPLTQQPTIIDLAAVWDEKTGGPMPAEVAQSPVLSGTFEVNGVTCRTAFDLLKDEIVKYPPEKAAKITEVPAETIIKLAEIAIDGPVTHRVGYGPQAYDNGAHAAFAGITLCALLGNIGKPGASYGANWNMSPGINWMVMMPPTGPSTSASISTLALREVMRSGKFKGEEYPIKAMLIYSGNPLSTAVNTNELKRDVFDNMEFIVTIDSALTDTARYSDIVLPCAQWFEVDDVLPTGQTHYIQYSPKAIDPLYESKSDADICRLIGEKMGYGELFTMTDEQWLSVAVESDYHKMFHINLKNLKQTPGMRYFQDPFIAWEGGKFLTPSGRMEIYQDDPKPDSDQGQEIDIERERLPRFFQPGEAWPDNPLYEKYPMVLMSERPRFRVHTQWFSTKWLRELDPEPTVKINPVDAEARGIANGGYVECYNDRGHCVARASVNDAIRPGTLVYPKSWQAHQHKAGSWSELSSSTWDPAAVNQSFMDNLCEVRIWEGVE